MTREKIGRWHPNQETDELIFAVCDRFLMYQHISNDAANDSTNEKKERGAAEVAKWLKEERGRPDLTREKIYTLLREARRRNFLMLQPPIERVVTDKLTSTFGLSDYPGRLSVVNVTGSATSEHITRVASDRVIELIDHVASIKRKEAVAQGQNPNSIRVHLGMGAGFATMLVAKKLANRVAAGGQCPPLVLHAISSGGFFIEQPHKAPMTYFSYFDENLSKIEYVALFSETVVQNDEYEKVKRNPALRRCFDRKNEIDIIVTSLASAHDDHGLLGQYLSYLSSENLIGNDVLEKMESAGWIGDVQFRPYSKDGPLDEVSPVRAVALFELNELVQLAKQPNKYVVLVAGPCGECGTSKTEALRPLLQNDNLRLWTDLITDVKTAGELLRQS